MKRGTTPTHIFTLPIETELLSELKIMYAQDDEILLEKRAKNCEMTKNTASVTLTQDETFLFNCKKPVQIQVRALTVAGVALISPIMLISVEKCLDSEVLKNDIEC